MRQDIKETTVAKSWDDLTIQQQRIVKDEADKSELLFSDYLSDLETDFESVFDQLREKYAHMFYTIDRDDDGQWSIVLEHTPIVEVAFRPYDYRNKLDYYEEYFKEYDDFPSEKYVFTFKIVDIYPGKRSHLLPDVKFFEFEVFPDDVMFDSDRKLAKSALIDVLKHTSEGKDALMHYATYYTEPLETIASYESYILGGGGEFGFDEWLLNELEYNGLYAVFEVTENGEETFVGFTRE